MTISFPIYSLAPLQPTWLKDQANVQLVTATETLGQFKAEQGVLLIDAASPQLETTLAVARTQVPLMGIVVCGSVKQLEKLPEQSVLAYADVLTVPSESYEIQARLKTAWSLSQLRAVIHQASQTDEETGLFNYRYFHKRLGEEMALAQRHLSPVTVVLFSLSYYDVYMDSFGYEFVSEVLTQAASALKAQTRIEDLPARLNDNELALLLPRTTEKGALTLTERILKALQAIDMTAFGEADPIAFHVGMAGFLKPEEEALGADALLRFARHALHTARCSDDQPIQLFSQLKPIVH